MRFLFTLALCAAAAPAWAQSSISAEIGRSGLKATEARLAALPAPDDAERFALAGVRFLGTVEAALQLRWRVGLSEQLTMLPVLRLPIAENPAPEPFRPELIAELFHAITTGMEAARAPLAGIEEDSDFALKISLGDIWFDINGNAVRDPGEDLMEVSRPMLLGQRPAPAANPPVIRFDAADVAWLSAYTHLLGGIGDAVLAYDPTAAITKVLGARLALHGLRGRPFDADDGMLIEIADMVAMVEGALNQPPDIARAQSAHAHFLAMIEDNRRFWRLVAAETDDAAEWLPNESQRSSALGVVLPAGTGAAWLAVLGDAEALLTGALLAPYWQLDATAGVNVGRLFTDPRPIDLLDWVQGAGALPYLEKGSVVDDASWDAFSELVGGEAMLMTVFLN